MSSEQHSESGTEAEARGEAPTRSARGAWIVLSCVFTLSIILGGIAWSNYKGSERHIKAELEALETQGKTLDTDGCVGAVLDWHARCEAMKSLCDHAIPLAVTHCLQSAPRDAFCSTLNAEQLSTGEWTYKMCADRGISREKGKGRSSVRACGTAYGAVNNYCLNGERGIAL